MSAFLISIHSSGSFRSTNFNCAQEKNFLYNPIMSIKTRFAILSRNGFNLLHATQPARSCSSRAKSSKVSSVNRFCGGARVRAERAASYRAKRRTRSTRPSARSATATRSRWRATSPATSWPRT